MNQLLVRLGRSIAEMFGLQVRRIGLPNRFSAMAETLRLLSDLGYQPRLVIDGGANEGQWFRVARGVFPDATFALIEPQSTCASALRRLDGRATLHQLALTAPGTSAVRLVGAVDGNSSGAFVARAGEHGPGEQTVPATTLDAMFAERVAASDRALLKLDLEGHEMVALAGATVLLGVVEVVVTEARFFEIGGDGRPTFADLLAFLRGRGFELFDVAALSARARDRRLKMGDVVFVRADSPLMADRRWE